METIRNIASSIADVCADLTDGFSAGCELRETLSCHRKQGDGNPLNDPHFATAYHSESAIPSLWHSIAFKAGKLLNPIEAGRNYSYQLDCGFKRDTFEDYPD